MMIRQPQFQGLMIRSNREDEIRWDGKGPIRKQSYHVSFHDSLYPAKGSKQHATPLAADEIRLESPFSEDGLQGTEIIILKSARLAEEAAKLTGKALLGNEDLKKANPGLAFFKRTVTQDQGNRISVPEELGEQLKGSLPPVIRDILKGDDIKLVSARRTIDRHKSGLSNATQQGELVQPLTLGSGRRRWAEHKERVLKILDQVIQNDSAKFVENVDTVEKKKKTLLFFNSRDTDTNIFNSISWQGDVNGFQGVYAAKQ